MNFKQIFWSLGTLGWCIGFGKFLFTGKCPPKFIIGVAFVVTILFGVKQIIDE